MKILGSIEEILALENAALVKFITTSSPWVADHWEPTSIGYVFAFDDDDKITSLCIVPHIPDSDDNSYKDSMTISLTSFDLYEPPAIYDPESGYWNVVAIFGQEFGCAIFLSSGFVASIPPLQTILQNIQEV